MRMKKRMMSLVAAALAAGAFGASEQPAQKNILLLVADDLKPLLSCYGDTRIKTPNFDRLADRGFVFENAFCQYPVCGPSRLSFLTGLRSTTTGCYGNDHDDLWPETVQQIDSLPAYFKKNGYYTVSVGKSYHSPKETNLDAWSEPPIAYATHVYNLPENKAKQEALMEKHRQGTPWKEIAPQMLVAVTENADVPDNAYMPGKHTDAALEKLELLAERQQPFFMCLGWFRPHYPFNAPKKYWDLYDREKLQVSGLQTIVLPKNEKVLRGKNWEVAGYGDVDDGPFDLALQKRMLHGYMACVSYVDAQLGRMLDELDRLGLTDNTAIILIGDHGFHLGDHGLWGKFTHLEDAARVPLIVADPGSHKGGVHVNALAELVDIYPTFCELAGLPVPAHCEGTSVVPLLKDPFTPWKKAVFTEYHLGDAWGTSMRTERFRYTKFIKHSTGDLYALSLYDLKKDPGSTVNVADDPAYQKELKRLEKLHHAGWRAQKKK